MRPIGALCRMVGTGWGRPNRQSLELEPGQDVVLAELVDVALLGMGLVRELLGLPIAPWPVLLR